ncbi:flagellar M-ring protein FliF [Thermodesulfovibrionales bacterium]|nr:flagellar M-ring protein FliF [Thermodesulfovibrionales bacterium]
MQLANIYEEIKASSLQKKIALGSVAILSLVIVIGIILWSQRIDYQILYANLAPEDAGRVIAQLREMNVPHRVGADAIFVPRDRVHGIRLDLAAQGIPQGVAGFELFDEAQIGVTAFVQRVNYIRALQGELARTLRQFREIRQARVHIVIPERTIFAAREKEATASVIVELEPGQVLGHRQIGAISHLVSSSVEGLQPRNVAIVDTLGNLLSGLVGEDVIVDAGLLEHQRAVNRGYEDRIRDMMEGIVGRGNVLVRVAANINFTEIEKTEEIFDPDAIAVRREQRVQEEDRRMAPAGIPGVLANEPGQIPLAAAGMPALSQRQSEDIFFEVSRSVSRVMQPRGAVESISVAVVVNGTHREENGERVFVPRSAAELEMYRGLIKAAIGYDEAREDQVIVESALFEVAIEELPPAEVDYVGIAMSLLKYIIPLFIALLLIFFVIRPLIRMLRSPAKERVMIETEETIPTAPLPTPDITPEKTIRDEVLSAAKKDPKHASMILKKWMAE